jgi:hypothetical protein
MFDLLAGLVLVAASFGMVSVGALVVYLWLRRSKLRLKKS